jgi:Ca-activated chloride channel family protein
VTTRRVGPPILTSLLLLLTPGLPGQNLSPGDATISVDVDLVVLRATVRDSAGEFVPGLNQEDFHIFEDGRPQTIRFFQHEDVPVSVGLLVDNSSSMGRKRNDVVHAAQAFVQSSNPQDQMFIVNFNERVSLGLPETQLFSASPAELEKALNGVPASGRTALYDAVEEGLAHLTKASHDRKVLIVISDGGDNASRHKLPQILQDVERSGVMVYTIGLFDEHDADQNPGILKKLARTSGGEAFFPAPGSEVVPVCQRIARDIRSQYTLGYTSTNPALDNTYRRIKVTATQPHGGRLFVRTRPGYFASPKSPPQPAGAQGNLP